MRLTYLYEDERLEEGFGRALGLTAAMAVAGMGVGKAHASDLTPKNFNGPSHEMELEPPSSERETASDRAHSKKAAAAERRRGPLQPKNFNEPESELQEPDWG